MQNPKQTTLEHIISEDLHPTSKRQQKEPQKGPQKGPQNTFQERSSTQRYNMWINSSDIN